MVRPYCYLVMGGDVGIPGLHETKDSNSQPQLPMGHSFSPSLISIIFSLSGITASVWLPTHIDVEAEPPLG